VVAARSLSRFQGDPLNILFATSECAPWVKTGGLGDVSAALPQALAGLGHDVRVLMPAYGALADLKAQARDWTPWLADAGWPAARLGRVARPGQFDLWLLDCPALFADAGGPYQDTAGRDHAHNARRFAFLARVAAHIAAGAVPAIAKVWRADVLHCNDWPTALAPAWLRVTDAASRVPSVVTIHNLAYQGLFPMGVVDALALPPSWATVEGAEFWGQLSYLKAGLVHADAITTVSPTYAREIRTEAFGCGLDGLLRAREADLSGILNGIDAAQWDPSTDTLIAARYDADGWRAGKLANRRALRQAMGLPGQRRGLLFGVVSRLASQKGIDLIVDSLPWLIANDCQLAVLGSGDAVLQQRLQAAAAAHPAHVAVRIGFDETLAHLIEAGADAFLMPSRYEPCGLNQMYSQRYGTPPVVHGTGGLADSVDDFVAAGPDAATGFVMPEATVPALQAAMAQALLVAKQPAVWEALCRRGMARDFGWDASARAYVALYEGLIAKR
jgi:starch synthase